MSDKLEFIKNYSEKLSKNQDLQLFTQKVQEVVRETNKLCPRKETLLSKFFNVVSITDNKDKVQSLTSLVASLKLDSMNYVAEHRNILKECTKYINENNETLKFLKENLKSISSRKENIDKKSDDYINLSYEEQDIVSSIVSCEVYSQNLLSCKAVTDKVLDNFNSIENSTIPSILNTIQTLLINGMNKSAIAFSKDISKLNNQSMIKMSESLVEAQRDVHRVMETAPIEQKTLDTIISNLENMNTEHKRFKSGIVEKNNKNIDDNQRVLEVLNKRNSIGLIEYENIPNK